MGRKPLRNVVFGLDANEASTGRVLRDLSEVYNQPNELNQRILLPKPNNLAEHRIASNDIGAAIQWVQRSSNGQPIPSYVINTPEGIQIREALVTAGKGKLAKNSRGDSRRRRLALDLELLAERFFPNMTNTELTNRAATKYEYINARGNEAHHILPISYEGKVINKLEELGIDEKVLDEMVRRKMAVGDLASNLASLQTKANPGREFLKTQDKSNVTDNHDLVHAMSEGLLEDLGLPMQNKGNYRLEHFMDDAEVSDYQKQAYAMAIPQAHRLAVQAVQLDPTKVRNQTRLLNSIVRLSADNAQAQMKLSPYTQELLQKVHGQAF